MLAQNNQIITIMRVFAWDTWLVQFAWSMNYNSHRHGKNMYCNNIPSTHSWTRGGSHSSPLSLGNSPKKFGACFIWKHWQPMWLPHFQPLTVFKWYGLPKCQFSLAWHGCTVVESKGHPCLQFNHHAPFIVMTNPRGEACHRVHVKWRTCVSLCDVSCLWRETLRLPPSEFSAADPEGTSWCIISQHFLTCGIVWMNTL